MKTYKKFWFLFLIFVININAQISGGGGEKPDGYDYLIITPDVFMQNATWDDELIALQTSRGFRPIIEEISVYTNTQGIKNLIEDYYNNNPLKYVLLMGNAKNLTPRDEPDTSLPYHYIEHGEIVGEVGYINGNYIPFCKILSSNPWNPNGELYIATDDPYVSALTSKGPVYIGRVPVTSVEEANDYVGKLSVYYQSLSTYSEAMNREILLNLDISWYRAGQQRPVTTGELVQEINAELINNHIPSTTTIYEFNVSEHNDGCTAFDYCWEREQLFKDYLEQGASVVSVLSTIAGLQNLAGWFWSESDINLSNKNTGIPFLIAPNCHVGEVNNPTYESVMRKLLVYGDGGIIGAIAPTEGTEQHANGYVLNKFHDLIYQDEALTYGEIFRILKDDLAANFSMWVYYVNGLTYFGDPSLVPSIYKHRSANMTTSKAWSGNIVVDNQIIITSSSTLTLKPGTNVFLKNNANLIFLDGKLNANSVNFAYAGTSNSYWGNLDFRGSFAGGSILNSSNIFNVNQIQFKDGANFVLENCYIKNSNQGLYIYNSQPQIINSIIENPQQSGIIGDASGLSPLIQGNSIKKINNMYSYQGIHMVNNTNARILGNDINGFKYGMYLGGGSCTETMLPDGSSPYPNNRVVNNRYGITTAWGSSTIAGWDDGTGAFNSIYGNTTYDAYSYQEGRFIAYNNYWGSDPQWYADESSYNEIDNLLSEDPWDGRQQNNGAVLALNKFDKEDEINTGREEISIFQGILLERQGKINQAIKFYKDLIRDNLYVDFALAKLLNIKNRYSRPEIKGYFQSIANSNNPRFAKIKKMIADIHLQDDEFNNAIAAYNEAISASNAYDGINARFAKLFGYLNINEDVTTASQILSELRALNLTDDEHLMKMGLAENLIESAGNNLNKNQKQANEINPETYALYQNYPNPFNPATVIKYQIPQDGIVSLKVYDILGKEVRILVSEHKSKGRYEVNFNASNLASGIYIYQLKVNDFSSNKKMMLIK